LILHNNGSANHWLGIALLGSKSNRQGIGARVIVTDSNGRKQIFDVSTAGSYLSASDPRIIAGLGNASGVKALAVRWPSGLSQTVSNPGIDRYITVSERPR
jgi:enediyne biosynthesis protein E4